MTSKQKLQTEIDEYNYRVGNLNEDGIECEDCKNKGTIAFAHEECLYVRPCHCIDLRHSIKMLERSGISREMLKKYTFDEYVLTHKWQEVLKRKSVEFVNGSMEQSGKWLYFGGQSGSGKTHLCTAIVQELGKKYPARYEIWNRLAEKLKFMDDKEQKEKYISELCRVEVLYVDDLFKASSRPTEADIRLLFDIINGRYLNAKSITIISSEMNLNQIKAIDEAIAGRIAERIGEGLKYVFSIPKDMKLNYRFKEAQP